MKPTSLSYRDAGVDIDASEQLVTRIKSLAKSTLRPEVLSGVGGFGGLVSISEKYKQPILVSSTDGVGTKLKLAIELQQHGTLGIDLVAMNVNDIVVQGAEPLFFLDYFACGKLDISVATEVIKGIASGCKQAGCALIGGETAEMPGMYPEGVYDLAGFAVGLVEKEQIITGHTIRSGDLLLGLASSGIHANGYSLVRHIVETTGTNYGTSLQEGGPSLGEILMEPTRIYAKPILELMKAVAIKGVVHITGGGFFENIPRVVPSHLVAQIDEKSWETPYIFNWLKEKGNVMQNEMYRTFNCGIGMVIIVAREEAKTALDVLKLQGETVYTIGTVRERLSNELQVQIS